MTQALSRANAWDMNDLLGVSRMWSSARAKFAVVSLATLVIGIAACGDDGDHKRAAPDVANGNARSGAPDLDRFLLRNGEEPGFRRGAAPGAAPESGETIT